MAFLPTKEQEKAINTPGNLLVSAAAGSGKTAVLVERVIQKLTDSQNPVPADRLLIVTFTNAAAGEMRSRIEKRLDEECRKNSNDIGLLRQKQLLPAAKICTVDSFCIDLVRENFDKVGVSPDFKISDGYSLSRINEEVVSEIILEYLESGDEVFHELIDIVGAEYGEQNLIKLIFELYDYSRQMPFPDRWFKSLYENYGGGEFTSECIWYKYAFDRAEKSIAGLRRDTANLIDLLSASELADGIMQAMLGLSDSLYALEKCCARRDWDEFYNMLSAFCLPAADKGKSFESSAFKTGLEHINKELESLKNLFIGDFNSINNTFKKLEKPVRLLVDILTEYEKRLFEAYLKANTFTFHNTEHLALRLLCEETEDGGIRVRPEASELLERFDEVMVDEYQDTNDLQDMLFYVLSGYEKRLFVVGDVKQSIYGFRGANPKNFLAKKNRYISLDCAKPDDPKKIILGNNFRSRKEICDYINFFFEIFMQKENGDIEYNKEERLVPSAEFPESEGMGSELHIITETAGENKEIILEARHIAAYIKEVMDSPPCLRAKGGGLRKAKYSDFAILMRSAKNNAPIMAAEMRRCGIPVNFSTEGYAETTEIAVFLSLLKVIDNPLSQVELISVMMSPIFGFTPDEMAKIRIESRDRDLFSAVHFAANNGNEHCREFLSKIESYRVLAVTLPLPKLISGLLSETGYLNLVSAMNDGRRRASNLLMLIDYAEQFSAASTSGLDGFVNFIIRQSQSGLRSAATTSGADTVNIMTIHASKGLQFPICIIARTGGLFNRSDKSAAVLYNEDLGLGIRYFDEETHQKVSCLSRQAIIDSLCRRGLEEELRLLYVAMTRAEEKLIFITAINNLQKKLGSYAADIAISGGQISGNAFFRTNSYSDWLMLSALLHPDGRELRDNDSRILVRETQSRIRVRIVNGADIPDVQSDNADSLTEIDCDTADLIKQNLDYSYPFDPIRFIESKSSVTALANKAQSDRYAFSARPAFMSDGGITAAERGTAVHKAIQFFDFTKCGQIEAELERLYEWQFLSESEFQAVDPEKLRRFFESDVFARIVRSDNVRRELRFLTELPAGRIDPDLEGVLAQEKVIAQGAVDLCFTEPDGVVILDFKTDYVKDGGELAAAYGEQLNIYKLACEKIFKMPVKQRIIYSFSLDKEIPLD